MEVPPQKCSVNEKLRKVRLGKSEQRCDQVDCNQKKNAPPAQIALAWLLAKKPFIVSIPGTRNVDHLTENLGAVNVQLTQQDMEEIEVARSKITIQGEIMSAKHMAQYDRSV